VKALVRALLNKINKNKIKIKELEKTLEELKKDNAKLKEDNAELKDSLEFKKDVVDSLIRSNSDLQTDLIAKGIDLDIANKQLKEYEDQNAFQAINDAKCLKKLKIKCNYDLLDDVDKEVKKLRHDSKEFDELIEKFIIDVSHKNATTEDQVKKIFEHYFWSPVDPSKRTDVRDKQYDMKKDFSEDLYNFGISIVYMYERYEEALNAIDSNNDLITKRLEELAKGREDSKTKFGYDPLSDEQLKIIKNLFTEYFKNANSIRKDIEWFFIVETPKYSPKLRELGKASDDYMK
jgi:chromosome segregation ATPase